MITIPNLIGMEQIETTEFLTQMGLDFQVWSARLLPENIDYYVIDQSIPASSSVAYGILIQLELSDKP